MCVRYWDRWDLFWNSIMNQRRFTETGPHRGHQHSGRKWPNLWCPIRRQTVSPSCGIFNVWGRCGGKKKKKKERQVTGPPEWKQTETWTNNPLKTQLCDHCTALHCTALLCTALLHNCWKWTPHLGQRELLHGSSHMGDRPHRIIYGGRIWFKNSTVNIPNKRRITRVLAIQPTVPGVTMARWQRE